MRQHVCNKTAFDRAKKGCRPVRCGLTFDEVFEKDGTNIADSAQAMRILKACDGTLDQDDTEYVIKLLREAGKLTSNEAESALATVRGETMGAAVSEAMAADRASLNRSFDQRFPNAARLKPADYPYGAAERKAPLRPMSHDQAARMKAMFPDMDRLKA